MTMSTRILAAILAASSCAIPPARATEPAPSLTLELNSLQPTDKGCRFTFVVTNGLGAALDGATYELVLFDAKGMVSRMTLVEFADLPDGKTKVRQFDFPGVECGDLGRVLINDATECRGVGIEPATCIRALETRSSGSIVFGV